MGLRLSAGSLANLPDSVAAPEYDRAALSPGILHVGVGSFHRSHTGVYLDRLFANAGGHDWAIIGAGVRDSDAVMRDRLAAQAWLTSAVELDPEGLPVDPTTSGKPPSRISSACARSMRRARDGGSSNVTRMRPSPAPA